jgi:Lon protease-like protein
VNNGEEISLFPLNTVLFPGGVLPLRVFEARYLDMISDCMRNQSGFGICTIRSGDEVGKAAQCYPVGTLARVADFDRGEDDLLRVTVQGERRFRIDESWVERNQLQRARVSWLEEQDAPLPDERKPLADLLVRLLRQAEMPVSAVMPHFDSAGWVAGRLAELLPFDLRDKQRLLETDRALERLEIIYHELLAEDVTR